MCATLLQGPEIAAFATWIFSTFQLPPSGSSADSAGGANAGRRPMSADLRAASVAQLLGELDADGDAALSLEEFVEYFRQQRVRMKRFKLSPQQVL